MVLINYKGQKRDITIAFVCSVLRLYSAKKTYFCPEMAVCVCRLLPISLHKTTTDKVCLASQFDQASIKGISSPVCNTNFKNEKNDRPTCSLQSVKSGLHILTDILTLKLVIKGQEDRNMEERVDMKQEDNLKGQRYCRLGYCRALSDFLVVQLLKVNCSLLTNKKCHPLNCIVN